MAVYGKQRGAGGGESGWFGYMRNLFQGQTGLSQLAWSPAVELDFADGALSTGNRGFQVSGTGAAAAQLTSGAGGGVVKVTGPTSAGGFADWCDSSVGPYLLAADSQTKRWMVGCRVAIGQAPASGSKLSLGVLIAGSTYTGLGFVGAQTTWQYVRGGVLANITNTGKTIVVDSTGVSGYLSMYVGNFDLTNVQYCIDVAGGAASVVAEAVTNLPTGKVAPYFTNQGTAGDIYFFDKVCMYVEL